MTERVEPTETYGLEVTSRVDRTLGESDGHGRDGSNDHLASVYQNRDEQFDTAVPFIREGLERGEQCLYVADDTDPEVLRDALREAGVDVESASSADALRIYASGEDVPGSDRFVPEFDMDDQLSFWTDELDEDATAGVRVAVEMTWALDGETGLDALLEYEAKLNSVFAGEEYVVLCQYGRDYFPPDVLSDVVRTHPLVVYQGTVCPNSYYRPPDEFLDPDDEAEIERLVDGLVDRARTEEALRERERGLSALTEVTADLMEATPGEIYDRVTGTTQDVLQPAATALWIDDSDGADGEVDLRRRTVRGPDESNPAALATACEHLAGRAFRASEANVHNDLDVVPASPDGDASVGSAVCLPLGDHGVMLTVAEESGAFDAVDLDFARTVASHTEALLDRAARERALAEREQKLEQFVDVVSHDLRNPLGIAQIYVDEARESGEPEDFDEVADALDRMETMIQNLQTMSQSGQDISSTEPVSVPTVAEEAWHHVETFDASLDVGPDDATLQADPERFQAILENLFRNAVEHGGHGVEVRVGSLDDGFYVSDTGPGIPPDRRSEVFENGYSAAGGSGFGLAIVREVVEAHGWDVSVTDSGSGGARFEVRGVDALDGTE